MAKRSLEVEINPDIIKWARERAGWKIEEISKKLKISYEKYIALESGKKKPTYKQLEIMSKYFKQPVAVFFLPKPPEEPHPLLSFRIMPKGKKEFSKDLYLTLKKTRYYQSIIKELLSYKEVDINPRVIRRTIEDNPSKVAEEERKNLGISFETILKCKNANEAFNLWRDAIERKNIFVFQFKFPLEDARGFTMNDKNPAVIVINSSDNILARIFTLAHEYAHIILGTTELYDIENEIHYPKIESWCNIFASELLIPKEQFINTEEFASFKISNKITNEMLDRLSKKFKVSKRAILTKFKVIEAIDEKEYKEKILELDQMQQKPAITKRFVLPHEKCLQEKGKSYISLVLENKEKKNITTHEAIEFLSLKLKHFEKLKSLISNH